MLSDKEDFYNIDGTSSVSETDSKLDSQTSIQKQQHFYWPLPEAYLRQCSIISLVAAPPFCLPRLRQLVSLAILAEWRGKCCYTAPNIQTHLHWWEKRGGEKKSTCTMYHSKLHLCNLFLLAYLGIKTLPPMSQIL